jgi:hypothetical protein
MGLRLGLRKGAEVMGLVRISDRKHLRAIEISELKDGDLFTFVDCLEFGKVIPSRVCLKLSNGYATFCNGKYALIKRPSEQVVVLNAELLVESLWSWK